MSDVTQILGRIEAGDKLATAELLPFVYQELRQLAAQRMSSERLDHTLQATGLVHEAFIRLVGGKQEQSWDSREHFFSAAAVAMRRILIDHARAKSATKRAAVFEAVDVADLGQSPDQLTPEKLLELDDTLQKLEAEDPIVAELVGLRLYAGLSVNESAKVMGISRSVAYTHWDYALSWFAVEDDS